MSASSKKRLRKEQEAALLTEKQLAAKKEAKKTKIYTTTFIVIMALVFCIAVGTIAYTTIERTGVFQRNTVAATIGEHELSAVDLGYYYIDAVSKEYSDMQTSYGEYAASMLQYLGLDITAPLNTQVFSASTGATWSDYFINVALENARGVYALYDAAMAAGFEMSEEDKTTMEENLQVMVDYADLFMGGDVDAYIEQLYGTGADLESYRNYVNVISTCNAYQADYYNSLSFDDAAIRAHEAEHYNDYTGYSFAYKFIDYNAFLGEGTKDAEGNVTYTDAEIAAANESARQTAESLLTAKTVEEFDSMISALEIYAPAEGETATVSTKAVDQLLPNILAALQEWLSSNERKEGDMTVLPYTTDTTNEDGTVTSNLMGYFAVFYQSKDEHLEPLGNVRHLLVKFEGGTTDDSGNTTYSDAEKNTAKLEAEGYLETWKKGAATEESFIELVKENSDDGSAAEGGLFEDIAPDSNYVTTFKNWAVDPAREAGDTEVIESEYGYHVMFYVGDSDITYRDRMIRDDLIANAYDTWIAEQEEGVTATLGNTKHMYHDYVIYSGY